MNNLYTPEEMNLFESLESKHVSMPADKLEEKKKMLQGAAKNTIAVRTKKKTINIRISEHDLSRIKALSLEQGVPYQTLIGSAVHKLASRELV